MSAKWTLASNVTAGDRLLYIGNACRQLSDGSLVMLSRDPSIADPNSITLVVVPGPAHTTPQVIATLAAANPNGSFSLANATPQAMTLTTDPLDNIYVFGAYSNVNGALSHQAFIKQSGSLTWTPGILNFSGSLTPAYQLYGLAATWCNTGTGTSGAGHILVIANTHTTQSGAFILDAGKVLLGQAALTQVTTNPAFLGSGTATTAGSNLDLDNDGFGATSGLAISAGGAGAFYEGSWGVSASGLLTTGSGVQTTVGACATLSVTTKLRIVRYAPNQWAIAVPGTAGAITVVGGINAASPSGDGGYPITTAGNFPQPGATLSWDVVCDLGNGIWVYGWNSVTPTQMLRVPVTFAGGVTTIGAPINDDTVGSGAGNTTIRTVKTPTDFNHADWQTYDSTTPYQLLGDFSAIPIPPNAPGLVVPLNATALALSTVGGFFDWTFSSLTLNDAQTAYYFRRQVSGGLYQWWTGSAWTTGQAGATGGAEVSVTSATTSVTLPTTGWVANTTYTWAIAVVGAGGASPYSLVQTVYSGGAQPATPTLAATYDASNNRVQLVVGGTGTETVVLNSSDDGGTTWIQIRASPFALVAGAKTVYDYEAPPGALRLYQAAQNDPTQGVYSVQSAFSSGTSAVIPSLPTHWIRVPRLLTSGIQVLMKPTTFAPEYDESETEYLGLGRADKIVISDVMSLQSGAVTFQSLSASDAPALQAMLLLQETLLWQTQDNQNLYVRFYGVRGPFNKPTPLRPGSYAEYPVTWVGQQRP
jgi:hypothetical protein